MTTTFQKAIEKAKALSADKQDQIGEAILGIVEQENSSIQLSPEQAAEVRSRAADPNPIFATDEQVAAVFAKFAQ